PHQYRIASPLRRRQEHSTVIPAKAGIHSGAGAIPAFAGMTERAATTARASASMAVAMTLAGPARSGIDGALSIRGIALHPPWKGRDGLRAGPRVSRGCDDLADCIDKCTQALRDPSAEVARRASFALLLSNPLLLGWRGATRTALGGQQSQ